MGKLFLEIEKIAKAENVHDIFISTNHENICKEDNNISMGDGAGKVFLNANGTQDDVRKEFDQRCFYRAFDEFDNQSIEKSLISKNLLVRIFAILDRRVEKRKLKEIRKNILDEPDTFQEFYAIRVNAEKIC